MTTYRATVHLLFDVDHGETDIPDALNSILTENMRKYSRADSCLIDWAFDLGSAADSIEAVPLAGDYEPDEGDFPFPVAEPSTSSIAALKIAEEFMRGFEGDEMQEGIDEKLATIRAAIENAGKPSPLDAAVPFGDWWRDFGSRHWQASAMADLRYVFDAGQIAGVAAGRADNPLCNPFDPDSALLATYRAAPDMLDFIKLMANCTTPEDEFEDRKGPDGTVHDDGVAYADADELLADFSDDRLLDKFSTFCGMIRAARKVRDQAEGRANG